MTKVESTERTNDFGLVGTLGQAYEYGQRIYGANYYGNEEINNLPGPLGNRPVWGIYQRRHAKGKVIFARLKFYTPKNPNSAGQQTRRTKFKNGMTAWANLTNEQRAVYNERAKAKHLHGVNLFLREYLKSN